MTWAIYYRFWVALAGFISIFFISKFLSQEEQGYFYVFNSLLALQIFIELGLTTAIIQLTSHEMAKLRWSSKHTLIGNPKAKKRLQSLMYFILLWFGLLGLLLMITLIPGGLYYLKHTLGQNYIDAQLENPWILSVIFSGLTLMTTPFLAFIEGTGKILEVGKIKFIQSIFSFTILFLTLRNELGLFSLSLSLLASFLVNLFFLYHKFKFFLLDIFTYKIHLPGMNWKKEIWSFQWRIAVSWISGFFAYQLYNPLLMATSGPVSAGKMGMSLQIISAINATSIVWISTKAPVFGKLIALDKKKELKEIFTSALTKSTILLFLLIIMFLSLIYFYLGSYSYIERIVSINLMALLCIACIANHIVSSMAIYLRAHKKEPFMTLSLAHGFSTLIIGLILIPCYQIQGAVATYFISSVFISLFLGFLIFKKEA